MGRTESGPAGQYTRALARETRLELVRREMDQKDLAAAAGMSTSYLSVRLRGERSFSVNDLEAIERALGLEPFSLLTRAHDDVARNGGSEGSGRLGRLSDSAVEDLRERADQ